MATYDCKTVDCSGKITFPEKDNKPPSLDEMGSHRFVVIEETPIECSVWGVSWYERELKK